MALTPDFASLSEDLAGGFEKWRIWTRTGWYDVKRRYKRTVLGPLWNTMSLAVLAVAMSYIWAPLIGADVKTFLPHILSGVLCWNFMATLINEGGGLFISAEGILKQLKFPMTVLVLSTIWRNLIVLAHNVVVIAVMVVLFDVPVTMNTLLFFPGLALICLNAFWFIPLIGLVSARFRDVPPVISNILTVFYFVTPVFWSPELLEGRTFLYRFNLLHHLMDMIRSPLLGKAPQMNSYYVVIVMLIIGSVATAVAFAYFRRRVTYWL